MKTGEEPNLKQDAKPHAAEHLRYVYVERPRCPVCRGYDLASYKTQRHPDAVSRYTRCRTCKHRFIVVLE